MAKRDGVLRLRVPYWAKAMIVDGVTMWPQAGRIELPLAAGERTFGLFLEMPPRLVRSQAPAATVLRGPLVLAKGRLAGTSRTETLDFATVNGRQDVKHSLSPVPRTAQNAAVWGACNLSIDGKTVPVADFWSVSCPDDPDNWFSLWF